MAILDALLTLMLLGGFFGASTLGGPIQEPEGAVTAPILIERPEDALLIKGIIDDKNLEKFTQALAARTVKKAEDGKEEVFIEIDSRGGNVYVGYLIMNIMNQAKYRGYHFTCFVNGDAMSMAFIIFSICDTRYAGEYSFLLFHPVRIFFMGTLTAAKARELATSLDIFTHEVDDLLIDRMSIDKKTYDYHNERETMWKASALKELSPHFLEVGILQ